MIEMKTAQLIGPALDWAVAKAEGHEPIVTPFKNSIGNALYLAGWAQREGIRWQPSTDWGQGGPLIERLAGFQLKIWLESSPGTKCEAAIHDYKGDWIVFGPTPLIAAMRCLVAAKLGDTVQIPSELIQ